MADKKDFGKQIEKMRKQPEKNAAFGMTGKNPFDRAKDRKEKGK